MSAIVRAEEDVGKGDYGQARQRLMSYLCTKGYCPDVAKRLGEINYRMHDPYEAGRFWLLSTAPGSEAERCIKLFIDRAKGEPWNLVMQYPAWFRRLSWDVFPPKVQARLQGAGVDRVFDSLGKGVKHKPQPTTLGQRIAIMIFCVVALLCLALWGIGLYQVWRWIWG